MKLNLDPKMAGANLNKSAKVGGPEPDPPAKFYLANIIGTFGQHLQGGHVA